MFVISFLMHFWHKLNIFGGLNLACNHFSNSQQKKYLYMEHVSNWSQQKNAQKRRTVHLHLGSKTMNIFSMGSNLTLSWQLGVTGIHMYLWCALVRIMPVVVNALSKQVIYFKENTKFAFGLRVYKVIVRANAIQQFLGSAISMDG